MKKFPSITTIAATLVLSAAAHAAGTDSDAQGKTQMQPEKGAAYGADADAYEYGFSDLDRNRDGYLSRDEAREHETLANDWDQADADRDGKLSESEFSAFEDDEDTQGKGK